MTIFRPSLTLFATAALALSLPHAASAREKPASAKSPKATTHRPKAAHKPAAEPQQVMSETATSLAAWVVGSGDNHGHPWIVVDKPAARAWLFDAEGKPLDNAPVLIGRAIGDDATPQIGQKSLSEIGPAEKTTPAGRYLARFGRAVGQPVLWVDYATSVAMHPIPPANKEHRAARMASPTIEDNRITFGCINVPKSFYAKVRPLFSGKGGYVYVLPDVKPLGEVFPLAVMTRPIAGAVGETAR